MPKQIYDVEKFLELTEEAEECREEAFECDKAAEEGRRGAPQGRREGEHQDARPVLVNVMNALQTGATGRSCWGRLAAEEPRRRFTHITGNLVFYG